MRDRVLRMERDISQSELENAANYINGNFQGWTIESIRGELERRLEEERSEYDKLMSSVEQLYRGGALRQESDAETVYVEGVSNLVVTDADRERLREMLRMLEEKQRIVELLSSYVDTKQEAVRVVIGLEDRLPEYDDEQRFHDREVLPVLWSDNYFSLLPGEKREITATYRAKDLGATTPVIEVGGWNVMAGSSGTTQ